ncbi:pyridoxal 5'-phosphate synthase subunit PdxT-like isoform X2 [Mercenaria mercenaria]|nr:pyridoxal 5'-phosphate synthase subunit PdxT-like isoform X2 [Mercenaria mercenaria]XP_053384042.1 pyridoxal 5'-phosphate synthase subunit PdxT-like isoform X2 [Mercenaria mercenaria]XP_053384043.1 pyridoxal 5'-phosphate synthase subunit PdxT-like isoform X2 [Mercenaria mercenaria]
MPPSGSNETNSYTLTVGLLEVQGAFLEHRVALQKAAQLLGNVDLRLMEIRTANHVTDELDGLVIPGGESTTISIYLKRNEMEEPLRRWIHNDRHVTWGTCAGMILLSKMTDNQKIGGQSTLAIMETEVSRNYFGRQVHSFESHIHLKEKELKDTIKNETYPGIFIRAPAIVKTLSPEVKILATLQKSDSEVIVAAQQGHVISTAFHPELTEDCSWHMYFLKTIIDIKKSK